MKTQTVGLYLGKFAPLHVGHEYIILEALKECDRLIVMIYDEPELTNVPLNIRAKWFDRFKKVEVIKCWNGPKQTGYTKAIMSAHNYYILKMLNGRKIDRFYSAEKYGEHVSRALKCKDCRIEKIPQVSATLVRSDIFKHRHMLNLDVYKDYVINCVFMGGPSTGKSTITELLAKKFNTTYMPEYGRDYWEAHQVNRKLTSDQLYELAYGHIIMEDTNIYNANGVMFTDTNAITTMLFNRYYWGNKCNENLMDLAERCKERYDLFFLCNDDFPMDDTSDRSGDGQRKLLQSWTVSELQSRKIQYFLLTGGVNKRIARVCKILKSFKKWSGNRTLCY